MINPIGWKAGSVLSFSVLLIAFLLKRHTDDVLRERLSHILEGLLRAEKKVALVKSRVAFGLGGCEDVFVDAMALFDRLDLKPPRAPRHHDAVYNGEQLAELMAFFFQNGAAAERYVANGTFFDEIISCTRDLDGARHKALGGNAPVMAQRMAAEGFEVILGARLTSDLAAKMHKNVRVVGQAARKNDIHLIMEYDKSQNWGPYKAARANRLIIHSDEINPHLSGLEEFGEEIFRFQPKLVIIGGLQMMDNFPYEHGVRERRLEKLESILRGLPADTRVHFELASFTEASLLRSIVDRVMPYADSLGMNEQELPNLVSLLSGGNVTLVSDSHPRVATVLDQMRGVFTYLGTGRLSRVHVHTLAFQAIATVRGSPWRNSMAAAAKAALTAHRHTCGSEAIDVEKTRILLDDSFAASKDASSRRITLAATRPVACWDEGELSICVAPGLVCTHVTQTAGGGDNISSAGLVLQI